MNTDRDQNKKRQESQDVNERSDQQHPDAFKQASSDKNADNIEHETKLEQERKEAMTETD